MTDLEKVREIAKKYTELANTPENKEKIALYKSVNDMHMIRPVVLVDELPWNEISDPMLVCECEDPFLRGYEYYFRNQMFRHANFGCDMYLNPVLGVGKWISHSSIGVGVQEITIGNGGIASHRYTDQFENDEDIEKLKDVTVTYNEEGTMQTFERVSEIFGDIMPVKITGAETGYGLGHKPWDDISVWRGVENLLIDLVERPEFMHALVSRLTDIFVDIIRQYDELNLFQPNQIYIHSTCASTDYFDNHGLNPERVHSKDVWGRGLAQIFAEVSVDMHDEFDTQYMKRAMEPFGLVYYGCCEPLDKKIDILKQIPNLRKISITPWANVDDAAEKIAGHYVIASKPNPAFVAGDGDIEAARAEIRRIIAACKRNNCSCDIVLKDISTIGGKIDNLRRWSEMAMNEAMSY